MEHNIFSSNIITNFEHVVRGRLVQDDFLVVVADYWEAAQFVGGLYVDEKSMIGLIQWARGLEEAPDTLLISIDGKYGAVAKMKDLRNSKPGYEWVYIGDIWAPVNRVKAEVQRLLVGRPEEARKLNLRAFQTAVPDRIVFRPGADFAPGTVSGEVRDAIRNVEGATDDALVWIQMLGITPHIGLDEQVLEQAKRETKMRIDKGSEFRSTFFPLNEVSLKEIEARGRRAHRDMERYRAKFPNEIDIEGNFAPIEGRNSEIERYCRRLSNDRLVELCVFLFNKEEWHGDSFKLVGMEFYRRVGIAGE